MTSERKFEATSTERQGVSKFPFVTDDATLSAATESASFACTVDSKGSGSVDDLGLGQGDPEKKVDALSSGARVWLRDILDWLDSRVDDFLGCLCKTSTSGRLFPLPSSPNVISQFFPSHSSGSRVVLRCLVLGLNSLNGEGMAGPSTVSDFQLTVLQGLMSECERVVSWSMEGNAPTWKEFLQVKGIDYKGEEVLLAQQMTWENVSPALPLEVGSVPLEQVVEFGSQHYVLNFEDYLLDPKDQIAVRPPRVMVPPENWGTFCTNLLSMGVFSRVHEDDIYKVGDRPLLNGLFGVSKNEFQGPIELMRIIMNMIPLNNVVRGIEGDVSTLPSWAGMTPLHLQPHEDLLVSSEDVRAFFYIFRVPASWHRFMCFNRPLPPELCGDRPGKWYPCSAVLPMGFKNSVALATTCASLRGESSTAQSGSLRR